MIAFGSLEFFLLLALMCLPALALGLAGRRIQWWGMASTVIVLGALLWDTPRQLALFLAFVVGQFVLVRLHLWWVTTRGREAAWERRLVVALALLPMALVKLAGVAGHPHLTFLGVSYLSFRAIQVILEISDGLITRVRSLDYLYFLTFFPSVASGPIDRSRRFDQDLASVPTPAEYGAMVLKGIRFVALGAIYKFVGAAIFARGLGTLGTGFVETWKYMYVYGLDLFFDFAGYSLMAVGVSYFFAIRTPVNFRMPFLSESIKDFWNRWHITLSFWFRDYIYSRMVMAIFKRKLISDRARAGHVAVIANMGIMGIWHGTGINFLLYGLYHGVLLALTDVYERRVGWHKRLKNVLWYRLVMIAVTFHLVMFSFLIFSGRLTS
ncbi:MAG TPA: D-alanyl-lipoteichoic acid biosynthesis protein DltB [Phycicoccus sp.]|jgi:membrane protein involved in D-alanine export|nr:D-alanyl-lipoteichoic acid biosynthesis protein DltB [Phycicoccus sp.]HQH08184.1 D-alanyl-lipoteichoic acid biosynthesis protein DltB [Phycicoccus sp.]HQK32817.1 D-alanyl-lipoteichoic acid biosynthesis protein DltB [Phycicoccus sp.]HRA45314.1 D-alanyl-lipoteichoic acid biosynthesis protein DltB [Phycicoccus sp.]